MFNLIGLNPTRQEAKLSQHGYINRVLERRLNKTINIYHHRPTYIKSNHILYRIIHSFGMPLGIPEEYVAPYIYNRAYEHANAHGLTSHRSMGKVHYDNFYGNGIEVIIQVDRDWDWDEVKRDWRTLSPIKVLRHAQNHFSFGLFTRENYLMNTGLSVIELDINLLHMQWYLWYHDTKRRVMSKGLEMGYGIGHYLGMMCLPNALPSHVNQVIINQYIMKTDDTVAKTEDYMGTPFIMNTEFPEIDRHINESFFSMRNRNMGIETVCANVLGVNGEYARDFQDARNVFFGRNNQWAYLLAVAPFIKHCIRTPQSHSRTNNSLYLSRLRNVLQDELKGKMFNRYELQALKPYYMEEIDFFNHVK